MYKIFSVPSPRGTNKAGLYALSNYGMAFDEMPPKAKKSGDGLEAVLRVLARQTSEARQAFFENLDKVFGEEAEDDLTAAEERHYKEARKIIDAQTVSDEPPPFKGRPRPGVAMDSAAAKKSFAERYPDAMKIGHGGVSVSPKLSTPVSTTTSKRNVSRCCKNQGLPMSAPKTNLRLADNSPPHVRAQLFAAIAAVREAEERLAANKSQIEKLYEKTWAAQTAVEDAEAAIEKAKETQLAYLSSCDSSEQPLTPRQARQKRDEAQESLEDIREARKLVEEAQKGLESSLAIAQISLARAISDLVRDDPAVKRLCENFVTQSRVLADMRRALDFLRVKQALPAEHRFILAEGYWPDLPGDKPWRAAFADLERDANAPLPEV